MGTGNCWGKPDKLRGNDLRWTSILYRGSRNTPSCFMLQKPVIRPGSYEPVGSKASEKKENFFFLIAFSYTDELFDLPIVYVSSFMIYRSLLLCGSGWLSFYSANDICPSGEASFKSFRPKFTGFVCRMLYWCMQLYIFYIFQKEYSLFLSIEEYQIPDIRNRLFDQYLQRYLGYSEEKVLDFDDEKVSTSVYCKAVNRNTWSCFWLV